MNIKNIDKAIAVMQRAAKHPENFSMIDYQVRAPGKDYVIIEEKLHTCGNTACFAGYLSLSPEWISTGTRVCSDGIPVLKDDHGNEFVGSNAVAKWLDISKTTASNLIYGDIIDTDAFDAFSDFYQKFWKDVKAEDVIAKLELIKSGELT